MSRHKQASAPSAHPAIESIVEQLTDGGAQVITGTSLRADHGCALDLRAPVGTASWRLAIDVEGAAYRRSGTGQQGKICDFLVIWQSSDRSSFGVTEMKSGTASEDALQQLQAGLNLIKRLDVDEVLSPRRAWLVCRQQNQQLKKLLLTNGGINLPYRGRLRVPVVVLRCGERLVLDTPEH